MGATFDKFAAKGEQVVNEAINKAKGANIGKKAKKVANAATNAMTGRYIADDIGDIIGDAPLINKLPNSTRSRISTSISNSIQGNIVGGAIGGTIGGIHGIVNNDKEKYGKISPVIIDAGVGAVLGSFGGGIAGAGIGAFGKPNNSIFENSYNEAKAVANKIKSWGTKQQTMSETVQPGGMYI